MTRAKSLLNFLGDSFAMRISLILGLLFFLLTPGVLLSVPPKDGCKWFLPIVFDNQTGCSANISQALVHSIVFGLTTYLILSNWSKLMGK